MNKLYILVLIIIIALPSLSEAQSFYSIRRDRSLIVSAGAGTSSYFGELKDKGKTLGPYPSANLNVGLQYFFTKRFAVRTELDWFQLRGNDDKSVNANRNLSFTSSNFELNAMGLVNLFPHGSKYYHRSKFNLYGFAGIGVLYTNPKAEYQGQKYALQPLKTEGVSYSRFQPVIPYGIGAKLKITPTMNVAVEGGWRLTFTDYLDDVSTVYPDRSAWDPTSVRYALADRSPELGSDPFPVLHKRGNPSRKDSYFLLSVKLEYYLAKNFLFSDSRKLYNKKRKNYRRRR